MWSQATHTAKARATMTAVVISVRTGSERPQRSHFLCHFTCFALPCLTAPHPHEEHVTTPVSQTRTRETGDLLRDARPGKPALTPGPLAAAADGPTGPRSASRCCQPAELQPRHTIASVRHTRMERVLS